MKKLNSYLIGLLVLVAVGSAFALVGCKKADGVYMSTDEATNVAKSYLKIQNDEYIFSMTSQEAEKLRISPNDYARFVNEVKSTNSQIAQIKQDAEVQLSLSVPKTRTVDEMILSSIPNTKSEMEIYSGRGILYDNSPHQFQVWVPSDCYYIRGNVWNSTALIGINTVTVSWGGVSASDNANRYVFVGGNFEIKLPASNAQVTITIHTSDSNGGSYSYEFTKEKQ